MHQHYNLELGRLLELFPLLAHTVRLSYHEIDVLRSLPLVTCEKPACGAGVITDPHLLSINILIDSKNYPNMFFLVLFMWISHYMLLLIGRTTDASSVTMTASCLCAMLLDLTSEEFLLSCSHFDTKTLGSLSELIIRSLQQVILSLYFVFGTISFIGWLFTRTKFYDTPNMLNCW
jgi:uncharacterized membrane protein YjjP (DUF1212 family)